MIDLLHIGTYISLPPMTGATAWTFITGYLIELSLSVDNLFAFYLIFKQLQIPLIYQRRVLAYGIWGAIILRLLFICCGIVLIKQFHWLLYLMGTFLLLSGIKLLLPENANQDLRESKTFKWFQRHIRITNELHAERFFVRQNNLLFATPLFIALIFIEIADIIFAFDSIPAIFAITTDPFIVWTSNILAILGLRATYFVLVRMITRLHLLKYGIALILCFVGIKMLLAPWALISVQLSLGLIATILIIFTTLSFVTSERT